MEKQIFFILLVSGLLFVGAEVFVPGGVLGAFGAVALLAAIATGFFAFPGYGAWIALSIVILVGVSFYLWVKLFPRSRLGKRMTVSNDLSGFKGTQTGLDSLVGLEGEALSDLRPSGFAQIGGKRIDVISEGRMLGRGTRVRVIAVDSNRVVVREVESNPPPSPANADNERTAE